MGAVLASLSLWPPCADGLCLPLMCALQHLVRGGSGAGRGGAGGRERRGVESGGGGGGGLAGGADGAGTVGVLCDATPVVPGERTGLLLMSSLFWTLGGAAKGVLPTGLRWLPAGPVLTSGVVLSYMTI